MLNLRTCTCLSWRLSQGGDSGAGKADLLNLCEGFVFHSLHWKERFRFLPFFARC
jgi:hypothetical protein